MTDDQPVISGLELVPSADGGAGAGALAPRPRLNLQRLQQWARREAEWIADYAQLDFDSDTFVFAEALKLVEEVGELQAELLGRSSMQRRSKLATYDQDSLAGELADVLICTAILAEVVGVDLQTAVTRKMTKVDLRHQREVRLQA